MIKTTLVKINRTLLTMNDFTLNFQTNYRIIDKIVSNLIAWTPNVLGLICYILLSYLFFKLFMFTAVKVLEKVRIEEKLKKWIPDADLNSFNFNFSSIIVFFLRIFLLLVFVIFGAELFGFNIISTQIGVFISFLPRLLVSIVLLILAMSFGSSASKILVTILATLGISGAKIIAKIISSILVFFISIIAIELVGIDTSIITTNFSIILGSIMITMAIGIGMGSVEVVRRIFFSFYLKKHLRIGQFIQLDEIKGRIVGIDGISVTIRSSNELYVIPVKDVVDSRIRIMEE